MGQPNPPGDNVPLIEGLDSSWNEIVSAIPEDRRTELGPKLKERITATTSQYEPLKQWEDLQKSGITPDFAGTAIGLFNLIENDPKQVYEAIGKHLNITPAQAKEVVEEVQDGDQDDPRIQRMEQQLETLAQIALAQRQMTAQEQQAAEADAAVDKELSDLKSKVGDFPEDEIVMRMLHKDMTAQQAYEEYSGRVSELQKRRPAPMLMGQGGSIPSRAIDVKKLDSKETKNLVAQMLESANVERNK
ncbi:MAG: hypothetical protein HMLIMOIP_002096 [Candidatus Nitrosomirales archaeon]